MIFKLYSGHDFMTDKVPREITKKGYMQELWFLHSACCLMLTDTYVKFRKDSLNGFQVIERTQVLQTDRCPGEKHVSQL